MSQEQGRSPAEWTSFAVCCVVLVLVVGLLAGQLTGSEDPPAPVATVLAGRADAAPFVVPVEVRNDGDGSAADVQVRATLTVDGATEEADVVVDLLGGGEAEEVVFTFAEDPAGGELDVRVTSFAVP